MKLTYWIAECLDDSHAYNIRAKTRKAVVAELAEKEGEIREGYGPPKKVTVEYQDAFDLMDQCMNEGRGYWEV